MRSPTPNFAFAWYFHLPAIASEIEVKDHVRGSLKPLMRVHRQHDLPYLLALTGSFLRQCQRYSPEILDELKAEIEVGRICLAATYLFETDPLSVPWTSIIEHVGGDLNVKQTLLGERPRVMFLPNFVWRAGLERILIDNGIEAILLDSRQLESSSEARAWRWESSARGAVHTSPVPVPTEAWEHRLVRSLKTPRGQLRLVFRDWAQTRLLTFGNDGAIHNVDPEEAITAALKEGVRDVARSDIVIVGDDGDRIRGTSLPGYESLLQRIDRVVDWTEMLNETPATPPLRELPSYSPPGVDALLRGSDDARFYWALLQELRSFDWSPRERQQQLHLDDVFYAYWPGVGRRQWYVDQALDWIEAGIERDRSLGGSDGSSQHPTPDRGVWSV